METDNSREPATKGDLNKVENRLNQKIDSVETTLKSNLTELKTELKNELNGKTDSVKTELKSDINRLETIAKTNTIDILHIKENIRDIRDTMSTKDDISRVMSAIDKFAAVAENYRRKDLVTLACRGPLALSAAERGHMLMVQEDKLQDHESRITLLETK